MPEAQAASQPWCELEEKLQSTLVRIWNQTEEDTWTAQGLNQL